MILNGKALWSKILGEPRENVFDKDNPLWSIDLVLTPETEKKVKDAKIAWKVKETDEGEKFIRFKLKKFKANGEENTPIEVIDNYGKPWNPKKLIGNGSDINVKVRTWEGQGNKVQTTLEAVQVVKLVSYNPEDGEEFPIDHDLNDQIDDVL